jgi:hypothetical protein
MLGYLSQCFAQPFRISARLVSLLNGLPKAAFKIIRATSKLFKVLIRDTHQVASLDPISLISTS